MLLRFVISIVVVLSFGASARADDVFESNQPEVALLTGGAFGDIPARSRGTTLTETILRFGRYGGPVRVGFLRGNPGWAAEAIPFMSVAQSPRAYGGAVVITLKYVLAGERIRPYIAGGLGALLTNTKVPTNTSDFNFKSHGALGLKIFFEEGWGLDIESRFFHISNNGMAADNPGINAFEVVVGLFTNP